MLVLDIRTLIILIFSFDFLTNDCCEIISYDHYNLNMYFLCSTQVTYYFGSRYTWAHVSFHEIYQLLDGGYLQENNSVSFLDLNCFLFHRNILYFYRIFHISVNNRNMYPCLMVSSSHLSFAEFCLDLCFFFFPSGFFLKTGDKSYENLHYPLVYLLIFL